jgi:hypothetical protein
LAETTLQHHVVVSQNGMAVTGAPRKIGNGVDMLGWRAAPLLVVQRHRRAEATPGKK